MKTLSLLDTFADDHLPCISFTYGDRELSLWWTDSRTVGAFYWTDSPAASKYLQPLLDKIDSLSDEDIELGGDECFTEFGTICLAIDGGQ